MAENPGPAGCAGIPDPIRVAIVEDQPEIREGLKMLIAGTTGYRSAGAYSSMEYALQHIGNDLPDVVLIDIGLPGMSGTEGLSLLKQRFPSLPAIVLTVYEDDDRIFESICAGACGYLLKSTPPALLLESLREVVSGGAPMSPQVARRVISLFREFRTPEHAEYGLTPHETRLLKLLVEGHNFKTAALEVGASPATIAWHMRHVYEKLQVHSKSEAVAKALREKIIS